MSEFIDVAAFAEMHGMHRSAVLRLLRRDAELPTARRRLPGAHKVYGSMEWPSKHRGEWVIPRVEAEAFLRLKRGRPSKNYK